MKPLDCFEKNLFQYDLWVWYYNYKVQFARVKLRSAQTEPRMPRGTRDGFFFNYLRHFKHHQTSKLTQLAQANFIVRAARDSPNQCFSVWPEL